MLLIDALSIDKVGTSCRYSVISKLLVYQLSISLSSELGIPCKKCRFN